MLSFKKLLSARFAVWTYQPSSLAEFAYCHKLVCFIIPCQNALLILSRLLFLKIINKKTSFRFKSPLCINTPSLYPSININISKQLAIL